MFKFFLTQCFFLPFNLRCPLLSWGSSLLYLLLFFHPILPHVDQITNLLDTSPINIFLKSLWVAVKMETTIQVSLLH